MGMVIMITYAWNAKEIVQKTITKKRKQLGVINIGLSGYHQ